MYKEKSWNEVESLRNVINLPKAPKKVAENVAIVVKFDRPRQVKPMMIYLDVDRKPSSSERSINLEKAVLLNKAVLYEEVTWPRLGKRLYRKSPYHIQKNGNLQIGRTACISSIDVVRHVVNARWMRRPEMRSLTSFQPRIQQILLRKREMHLR